MTRVQVNKPTGNTSDSKSEFVDLSEEVPNISKLDQRIENLERQKREEEEREQESSGRCGCW